MDSRKEQSDSERVSYTILPEIQGSLAALPWAGSNAHALHLLESWAPTHHLLVEVRGSLALEEGLVARPRIELEM